MCRTVWTVQGLMLDSTPRGIFGVGNSSLAVRTFRAIEKGDAGHLEFPPSKACRDGYSALYTRAKSCFEISQSRVADGSLRSLLARLSRIDVLVIDDWVMALSEPERRDSGRSARTVIKCVRRS